MTTSSTAGLQVEVREGKESRIRISLACPQGNVAISRQAKSAAAKTKGPEERSAAATKAAKTRAKKAPAKKSAAKKSS